MSRALSLFLLAGVMGAGLQAARAANRVATFKDCDEVSAVAFTPDGKALVTGGGRGEGPHRGEVKLWDTGTGRHKPPTLRFGSRTRAVAVSPDGTLVAVSTSGMLQGPVNRPWRLAVGDLALHDAKTGRLKAALKSASLEYYCLAFSPDGKTLAAGSSAATNRGVLMTGGVVRLWDVAKGKERAALKGQKGNITSVAFSPDGKTLASASRTVRVVPSQPDEGEVRLWDLASGKATSTLSGLSGEVWSATFSPDGKLLATGGKDRIIRLWDVATTKEVAALHGHASGVSSLAFSPDGKVLASAGGDPGNYTTPGELKLWDVARRVETDSLKGHDVTALSVAFDPKGGRLACGGMDGTVTVWEIAPPARP